MLRRLRHPNIVLFYGAVVLPQTCDLVIVMELVQGTRLDKLVVEPPHGPDTGQRCKLVKDFCCALTYLHTQNPQLVHGDVKDSNAMVELSPSGAIKAKLLDFGLGRVLTKSAKPLGGTVAWRAPELMCQQVVMPHASADVFSFGRLMYKIITGRRPLEGWCKEEILIAARGGLTLLCYWPPHIALAEACQSLSERCTHITPQLRPSISEIEGMLREACGSWWPIDESWAPLDESMQQMRHFASISHGAKELLEDSARKDVAAPPQADDASEQLVAQGILGARLEAILEVVGPDEDGSRELITPLATMAAASPEVIALEEEKAEGRAERGGSGTRPVLVLPREMSKCSL